MSKTVKYSGDENIQIELENGAKFSYINSFLNEKEEKELFEHLLNISEWMHGVYNMFGKPVKTPRLLWAMREDKDIISSYNVTGSSIWTDKVEKIKSKIEKTLDTKLTYVQLNKYRNGNDYIGAHADKEVLKGDVIASLSLGCARRFIIINRDKTKKYEINLKPGSLLMMNYECANKYYKHMVPKEKNINDVRINATFRNK